MSMQGVMRLIGEIRAVCLQLQREGFYSGFAVNKSLTANIIEEFSGAKTAVIGLQRQQA